MQQLNAAGLGAADLETAVSSPRQHHHSSSKTLVKKMTSLEEILVPRLRKMQQLMPEQKLLGLVSVVKCSH